VPAIEPAAEVKVPHMLVMTATPIPRSLALTVYGDLDLSLIDDMPPGRAPIRTQWLTPERRDAGYALIRQELDAGHQAFIVYPLVEESERSESKAAVDEAKRLATDVFPDRRIGLLHGRMSSQQKDLAMRAFKNHETDILVSTAVVEVGVDVPNATVMMIEGADRFGLAQLHQFRGRVGRGSAPGFCVLIADETDNITTQERLRALERTTNGLELAEIDLKLRGPGDFLGTRQSGLPALRLASVTDLDLVQQTRSVAQQLIDEDPDLEHPEHARLKEAVATLFAAAETDVS
jgi:ATP-dependent DNA helicase RecG